MRNYLLTLLRSLDINQLDDHVKGNYRFAICSELLLEIQGQLMFLTNNPGDKNVTAQVKQSYIQFRYYHGAGYYDKSELGYAAMRSIIRDIFGFDTDEEFTVWEYAQPSVMDGINDLRTSN